VELLLILLLVPLAWLLLLPRRVAGFVRAIRIPGAGILIAVMILGLILVRAPRGGPADYAAGDAALRALLEPTVATR